MVDGFTKTPRYILREDSRPIGPVLQAPLNAHTVVIYGFSDKSAYDVFLSGSALALTPYPLVQRYLQSQIDLDSDSLRLVALDAASPADQCLYAATFQSVVESLQSGSGSVAISHQLILDEFSSECRIEAYPGFVASSER